MADKEYKEKLNFILCPVCGGELRKGRIAVLFSDHSENIRWYSDETIEEHSKHKLKSILTMPPADKMSYVKKFENFPVPAGYCESCDRVFAEIGVTRDGEFLGEKITVKDRV